MLNVIISGKDMPIASSKKMLQHCFGKTLLSSSTTMLQYCFGKTLFSSSKVVLQILTSSKTIRI